MTLKADEMGLYETLRNGIGEQLYVTFSFYLFSFAHIDVLLLYSLSKKRNLTIPFLTFKQMWKMEIFDPFEFYFASKGMAVTNVITTFNSLHLHFRDLFNLIIDLSSHYLCYLYLCILTI